MSDSLQATQPPIASGHAVDHTRLTYDPPAQPRCARHEHGGRDGAVSSGHRALLHLELLGYSHLGPRNGHTTMRDIHAVLCDRFDVSPDRALDDLVALANQLVQEGLLQQERR